MQNSEQGILENLTYLRVAYKAKDGDNGFLYIHTWPSGYQELVFSSHTAAERFKAKLNTEAYRQWLKMPAGTTLV